MCMPISILLIIKAAVSVLKVYFLAFWHYRAGYVNF